jgi:hypothetical protein
MTEPRPTASEVPVRKGSAVAFAAALGVTLFMAAPVIVAPTERIFGSGAVLGREDPNRDALVVIDQLRSGRVPAPYLQPLTDLPARALARVVGPVAAYNVLVLATFPLSAAAAYLLARHVLGSHAGAMVAALAYAFLPFHVAQAGGHPHIAQTQWVPLYLLALWRCFDRPDIQRAGWLMAAAAAVALSDFYAGLIAAVLSPAALVAYAAASPEAREGRWRRVAITGLVLAATAVAGVLLVSRFASAVLMDPGSLAVPRSELFAWSAKWWSYLVPPVEHPLWGSEVREFWVRRGIGETLLEHQQVGLGWSLLALGAVPLWLRLRAESSRAVRLAPALAVVAGVAVLCSLAPERTIGPFIFVRPSALLYELVPMFRAYARFAVAVGLMTALLAGAGVASLWSRRPAGRRAAVVLLALAVLEYAPFPPWRWRDVLPTRAHRWLAAQAGSLKVLDCVPPSRVSDSLALTLLGHEASLLGAPGLDDCGEPALGDKLRAKDYTHVVIRADSDAGRWLAAHPPKGLAPGPRFEDGLVFEVKADAPRAYVSALAGFYPREYDGAVTWRWMAQTGALRIVTTAESEIELELDLKAFPGPRRVAWLLDARPRGVIEVGPAWRRHALPLGTLPAGEITVTLATVEPAMIANGLLLNDDPRALALAVGSWKVQ